MHSYVIREFRFPGNAAWMLLKRLCYLGNTFLVIEHLLDYLAIRHCQMFFGDCHFGNAPLSGGILK